MNKLDILERILMVSQMRANASPSPVSQRLYAVRDSILDLEGVRIILKKGGRIIYPIAPDGNVFNIILTGNAHIEVCNGYRLAMAYGDVIVTAADAAFSITKKHDALEVAVYRQQVFASVNGRRTRIAAHQRGCYSISSGAMCVEEMAVTDI